MNIKKNSVILILILIILIHATVLSKIFFFPYPEIFVYPYLTNNGLIPYKDILDQHFPGLMFLPLNFNNLGMTDPTSARVWLIVVVAIVQILLFITAKKIFKNSKLTLLPNFIYLLWQPMLEGFVPWMENYLPLFYLPAFYIALSFLEEKKSNYKKIVFIGFFMSLALLFKQVAIPLTFILLLFLLWETKKLKTVTYYLLGFIPIPLITALYFYSLGALWDLWFWAVWFNLTTFAQYGRKGGSFSSYLRVIAVFAPIILLPFSAPRNLTILLFIFTFGSLAGAFNRFDFVHFQAGLPFAAIILALVIKKIWKFSFGKLLTIGFFLIMISWTITFYRGHLSNTVLFWDNQTLSVAERIKEYTNPKEEIFLFGPVLHLYYLSDTLPAGKVFVFQFPWFMMEAEDRTLTAIKKNPPALIVRDRTVVIEGRHIKDFAAKLDKYIIENYEVFDSIGANEFMRTK